MQFFPSRHLPFVRYVHQTCDLHRRRCPRIFHRITFPSRFVPSTLAKLAMTLDSFGNSFLKTTRLELYMWSSYFSDDYRDVNFYSNAWSTLWSPFMTLVCLCIEFSSLKMKWKKEITPHLTNPVLGLVRYDAIQAFRFFLFFYFIFKPIFGLSREVGWFQKCRNSLH